MRIVKTSKSTATCTLGRAEKVLQVEGVGDGPALFDAKLQMMHNVMTYMETHPACKTVRVVAAAQYGGFTVDYIERAEFFETPVVGTRVEMSKQAPVDGQHCLLEFRKKRRPVLVRYNADAKCFVFISGRSRNFERMWYEDDVRAWWPVSYVSEDK